MFAMENTRRDKYNCLCVKQATDGVGTPIESKVGEVETMVTTRRRHDLGNTSKNIFAHGSEERKS